jgi:hypothetical protein
MLKTSVSVTQRTLVGLGDVDEVGHPSDHSPRRFARCPRQPLGLDVEHQRAHREHKLGESLVALRHVDVRRDVVRRKAVERLL